MVKAPTTLFVELPFASLAAAAERGKAVSLILTSAAKAYVGFAKETFVAYRLSNCDGTEFASWSENSVLIASQEERLEFLKVIIYQIEFTRPDGSKVMVIVDFPDAPGEGDLT